MFNPPLLPLLPIPLSPRPSLFIFLPSRRSLRGLIPLPPLHSTPSIITLHRRLPLSSPSPLTHHQSLLSALPLPSTGWTPSLPPSLLALRLGRVLCRRGRKELIKLLFATGRVPCPTSRMGNLSCQEGLTHRRAQMRRDARKAKAERGKNARTRQPDATQHAARAGVGVSGPPLACVVLGAPAPSLFSPPAAGLFSNRPDLPRTLVCFSSSTVALV